MSESSFCRKEIQRVLAEVTDHMEQQYSAHRYLEKLRSENENIALKEKERTVRKIFNNEANIFPVTC